MKTETKTLKLVNEKFGFSSVHRIHIRDQGWRGMSKDIWICGLFFPGVWDEKKNKKENNLTKEQEESMRKLNEILGL